MQTKKWQSSRAGEGGWEVSIDLPRGESCLINQIPIEDKLAGFVDMKRAMDVIYLACFNKAYNTVLHNALVFKLGCYRLNWRTTKWVKTSRTVRL